MSEIEVKIDDLMDRFDLMQSEIAHLGDRISFLITMARKTNYDAPPPMLRNRKSDIMKMLMDE